MTRCVSTDVFDVSQVTLEEIDVEYAHTLDKLERLSKLREAVAEQDQRRVKKLIDEYQAAKMANDASPLTRKGEKWRPKNENVG